MEKGAKPEPAAAPDQEGPVINPVALAALLVAFVGLGTMFGFLRAALGIAMFVIIAVLGVRQMRSMVAAPPDPEIAEVSSFGLTYVCSMCGLRLKVEVAARDKPPSHCMEPMILERTGEPPVRPLDRP